MLAAMWTFMAGPNYLDISQFLTFLQVLLLPIFLQLLFLSAIPNNPHLRQTTNNVFVRETSWWLRGASALNYCKRVKKSKKPRVRLRSEHGGNMNNAHTYLVPLTSCSFRFVVTLSLGSDAELEGATQASPQQAHCNEQ